MKTAFGVAAFVLGAASLFGAVEGTVVNKTTGKPQPGASVLLMNLGQGGMQPVGTVKTDAQGKFRFEQDITGAALLQATHAGVTYSIQVSQGTAGPHEITVYESSREAAGSKIAQHTLVLEPLEQFLNVTETFFWVNEGNTTYHDPNTGLRFFVPKGSQPPVVTAAGPHGMPLQRVPRTHEGGVYSIDFPIKPGETRIDVRYTMPFKAPGEFATKVLYDGVVTRVAVPNGVTLKSAAAKEVGREPTTQAAIYEVSGPALKVTLEGSGQLATTAATAQGDEEGPRIQAILPRVYERAGWIVAAALIALACGFAMLYRRGANAA